MKTLLEKALEQKEKRKLKNEITDEEIILGIAWLKNEVSIKQCCLAVFGEYKSSHRTRMLTRLPIVFKVAFESGILFFRK